MACVYKIVNLINGNVYIGSTIQKPSWRKYCHWSHLKRGKHHNPHLQNSYQKYISEVESINDIFEFITLMLDINIEELIQWEQSYLDKYRKELGKENVYNIGKCVANPRMGQKHSQTTKDKISESHRGKILSQEHKDNLSKAGKGRKTPWMEGKRGPMSDEHKKKISDALKGRVVSEEHKENLRKALKGKPTGRIPPNAFKKGHTPANKKT